LTVDPRQANRIQRTAVTFATIVFPSTKTAYDRPFPPTYPSPKRAGYITTQRTEARWVTPSPPRRDIAAVTSERLRFLLGEPGVKLPPPCRSSGECALSLAVTADSGVYSVSSGGKVSLLTTASREVPCGSVESEGLVPSESPAASPSAVATCAASREVLDVSLAHLSLTNEQSSSLLPRIELVPFSALSCSPLARPSSSP